MKEYIFFPQTSTVCSCPYCVKQNAKHGTNKTWVLDLRKKKEKDIIV